MMADLWVLVVIFIALAIGFFLGAFSKRSTKKTASTQAVALPWTQQRYVEGLTYLLNEQTDEAVDYFIAGMEVNAQTLEVHLSLGNLLRRKGEIARAVKVHQNLLSRPSLGQGQLHLVQFELAKDYISSGLLDRAEMLLVELAQQGSIVNDLRLQTLRKLIDVYQDSHEWLKAIDIADQLTTRKFSTTADTWREAQAHYSCELAEQAMARKEWSESRKWIRSALHYNRNSVRATLLQSRLDMDDKKYPAAIATLKKIIQQNPSLGSEMIVPLYESYHALESLDGLKKELSDYLQDHDDLLALHYLSELTIKEDGYEAWLTMMEAFVNTCVETSVATSSPVLTHMNAACKMLELIRQAADQQASGDEAMYKRCKCILDELLKPERKYECMSCGFEGTHIHWLCPSCKRWESMRLAL